MKKRQRAWVPKGRPGAKRHIERELGPERVYTAVQELCPDCDAKLPVFQNDGRRVQGMDRMFWMRRRDKKCGRADCPGKRPLWPATRDLRVVLPGRIYGLDVTVHVGERHLLDGVSLSQIARELAARGLPLDQRHAGRVFRDFLALTTLARGDDTTVRARLLAQGGIVLMCDGVQFEDRSPVLYLVWDAISGEPLFGERKQYRGEEDLVPLLERVRAMDVPIIGIVTDKETGLVPAVERVFPGTPYQFCQTHFLKNCAKPLAPDLGELQASVKRRAEAVRDVGRSVAKAARRCPANASAAVSIAPSPGGETEGLEDARADTRANSRPTACAGVSVTGASAASVIAPPGGDEKTEGALARTNAPTEAELALEICEIVRANSRVSGKAPLDPAELKRHERMEQVRAFVGEAVKKKVRRQFERVAVARAPSRGTHTDLA